MNSHKAILIPLLCLISVCFAACHGYEKANDTVYWKSWNEGNGTQRIGVDSVDAETFRVLENPYFGADKNHVYFEAGILGRG